MMKLAKVLSNWSGVAVSSFFVLCLSFAASAQEPPPGPPYATGLRPPTSDERDWMDKHLKKTKKVKLNKLGLERVNQHRRAKGLPPLDLPAVPDGQEVVGDNDELIAPEAAEAGAGQLVGATLPAVVDNSALPSFPPVRSQGSIG